VDVVTGQWSEGRVATVRGIRKGKADYGCVVFTKNEVKPLPLPTKVIYRELCKQIATFFTTRKPPVDPAITIEMMAFIEAANKSGMNHGAGEKVAV
jgi:virulence factor